MKVEFPGMKKGDVEVTLCEGTSKIAGERKSEKKFEGTGHYRSEHIFGLGQRAVTLPATVAGDKVKANHKNGILTITLPKSERVKPRKIAIAG